MSEKVQDNLFLLLPGEEKMKIIIWIFVLLVSASAAADVFSQNMPELEKLVATEKAFARTAAEKSARQAFLAYLAEDGVVFEPGAVNGREVWQKRPESNALLAWSPVWADIAADGAIGYTTGGWSYHPGGRDAPAAAYGQYITIWQKQTDGDFRAVLDIGISHEKPESLSTEWKSPSASAGKKRPKDAPALQTDGFKKLFAEDVRLYRDDKFPYIGKKAALAAVAGETGEKSILKQKCDVHNDFGYCYGEIEKNGEKGNVLQIWRVRNGKWRIVLDLYSKIQ